MKKRAESNSARPTNPATWGKKKKAVTINMYILGNIIYFICFCLKEWE